MVCPWRGPQSKAATRTESASEAWFHGAGDILPPCGGADSDLRGAMTTAQVRLQRQLCRCGHGLGDHGWVIDAARESATETGGDGDDGDVGFGAEDALNAGLADDRRELGAEHVTQVCAKPAKGGELGFADPGIEGLLIGAEANESFPRPARVFTMRASVTADGKLAGGLSALPAVVSRRVGLPAEVSAAVTEWRGGQAEPSMFDLCPKATRGRGGQIDGRGGVGVCRGRGVDFARRPHKAVLSGTDLIPGPDLVRVGHGGSLPRRRFSCAECRIRGDRGRSQPMNRSVGIRRRAATNPGIRRRASLSGLAEVFED